MQWKKIADGKPKDGEILYIDPEWESALLLSNFFGKWVSSAYMCNKDNCNWIPDDCFHEFTLRDDGYWMEVPQLPDFS